MDIIPYQYGTGRCSTEIIGNQYSSRATAGGQMLCPPMLKMLWRQLNPMPHACLGLSPILHASPDLLCLSHLPVARLDLASAVHPHGSELDLADRALTTATKFLPLRQQIQSQWAATTEFVCAWGFVGLFPCLSAKSNMNKIFSSSVIPLALTFVPLLPAKYPTFSLI